MGEYLEHLEAIGRYITSINKVEEFKGSSAPLPSRCAYIRGSMRIDADYYWTCFEIDVFRFVFTIAASALNTIRGGFRKNFLLVSFDRLFTAVSRGSYMYIEV